VRCLYLALPEEDLLEPWFTDVREAAGDRAEVVLFDRGRSFAQQVAGARAVIDQGGSVGTREMIDAAAAAGVELYQVHGTGLDHVDVAYMLSRGLRVAHCSGVHSAPALAEHALCLLLAVSKRLPQSRTEVEAGVICGLLNDELSGKVMLLVGFGASARELAPRARALGLRVFAIDRAEPETGVLERLGVERFGDPGVLDEVLAEADFVSLHLPLTEETRSLLDRRRLALMRETAILINVARGGLVDEGALVEALAAGRLAGAGLDVFSVEPLPADHPLLRLPNVVLTPHLAGVTSGTSRRRGAASAENLARLEAGTPLLDELFAAP
jgi:phosphoglycerate dehydrogenase-like enzyme